MENPLLHETAYCNSIILKSGEKMGARKTLNSIYMTASLVLAALVGWAAGSWTVFAICLVALIAANLHAGRIRPGRRDRRSR